MHPFEQTNLRGSDAGVGAVPHSTVEVAVVHEHALHLKLIHARFHSSHEMPMCGRAGLDCVANHFQLQGRFYETAENRGRQGKQSLTRLHSSGQQYILIRIPTSCVHCRRNEINACLFYHHGGIRFKYTCIWVGENGEINNAQTIQIFSERVTRI